MQGPGFPRLGAAPGIVDIALPPLVPVNIALPPLVPVIIALPCVSPGNLDACCMRIILLSIKLINISGRIRFYAFYAFLL